MEKLGKLRDLSKLTELSRGEDRTKGPFEPAVGFLGPSNDTDSLVFAALTPGEWKQVCEYFEAHKTEPEIYCETDAIGRIFPERLVTLNQEEWIVYSHALRGML